MTDATAAQDTTASGAGDQSGSQTQTSTATDQGGTTALTQTPKANGEGTTASGDAASAADGQQAGKPAGASQTYAEFTAPEGITLDKAMIEKFTPLASELGLQQEAAQKVIDLYAKDVLPVVTEQITTAVKQQQEAEQTQKVEGWLQSAMKDPEIGGARFDETVSIAKKALDAFGTPELKAALDDTGLGNHPDVIRLLANIGKRISEDRTASTTSATGGTRSAADILYGSN